MDTFLEVEEKTPRCAWFPDPHGGFSYGRIEREFPDVVGSPSEWEVFSSCLDNYEDWWTKSSHFAHLHAGSFGVKLHEAEAMDSEFENFDGMELLTHCARLGMLETTETHDDPFCMGAHRRWAWRSDEDGNVSGARSEVWRTETFADGREMGSPGDSTSYGGGWTLPLLLDVSHNPGPHSDELVANSV